MVPHRQTGTRRAAQKAETRARILDAARALFEEKGYEDTTMRAVATRANVASGTIFVHFADKGELLIEALLEDLHQVDAEVFTTLPADAPLVDQVLHLARVSYAYWGRRPSLSRVLIQKMWFVSGEAGDRYRAESVQFLQMGAGLLEQAKQRGELADDCDTLATVQAIYAFHYFTLIANLGSDEPDVERMLDETRRMVEQLLRGAGPGRTP